jgi:hypothetical protein
MAYTLGQAAKACGRSKMTIARAVKAGRLSASRTKNGTFAIDPAELSRVYPVNGNGSVTMGRSATGGATHEPAVSLADLLAERNRLVTEQAETIRRLWERLDAEAEERRRLIAVLTDQRSRPWWRRWFR